MVGAAAVGGLRRGGRRQLLDHADRPVHNAILPEFAETPEELTACNAASGTLEGLAIFVGPVLNERCCRDRGPWLVFAVMTAAIGGQPRSFAVCSCIAGSGRSLHPRRTTRARS